MGLDWVAIAAQSYVICLKMVFSDGLGGVDCRGVSCRMLRVFTSWQVSYYMSVSCL